MKNITHSLKRFIMLLFITFGLISCNEELIVVSDSNVYHVNSGKIFSMEYDSTLQMFESFTLSKEEYRRLAKQ